MSSRRDIRTNKAAKLMIQQIGAGEVLSGWQPEPGGARKFWIGDSLEEYGWGAVWPLFDMGLVEEDLLTPDGFIEYKITDAGRACLARRAQAKAA
jgi:hypothetical protein